MLARYNLPRVLAETGNLARVLDVGGCASPLNTATHMIDCLPSEAAGPPLVEGDPVRVGPAAWTVADVCDGAWPFADGYFDFAFCSHLLEDVRDPIFVCRELSRVARAGYVETPSRLREALHQKGGYHWRRLVGRPLRVGFGHHRWFVEREGDGLVFTAKTLTAVASPAYFMTAEEVGRALTPEEAALSLFWQGGLQARERLLIQPGETEADLADFKRNALRSVRASERSPPAST
jgi:hypothetical protein